MTQTALVTEASCGIGCATAAELASSGFRGGVHYNTNTAAVRETLAALPGDGRRGVGRIIPISSRAGLRGEAGFAGYAASKAAQISLTKSLVAEPGPAGGSCFAVTPGWAAKMFVPQITPLYSSSERSQNDEDDTTSLDKNISAIVSVDYSIR